MNLRSRSRRRNIAIQSAIKNKIPMFLSRLRDGAFSSGKVLGYVLSDSSLRSFGSASSSEQVSS